MKNIYNGRGSTIMKRIENQIVTIFLFTLILLLEAQKVHGLLANGYIHDRNTIDKSIKWYHSVTKADSTSNTVNEKNRSWFPTRATDALAVEYHDMVMGATLKHILVHTKEMADLVIQNYLEFDHEEEEDENGDRFGWCAKSVSLCEVSKNHGGRIGYVENPFHAKSRGVPHEVLSEETLQNIFEERPKVGDILKIQSDKGWHVIMMDDISTSYIQNTKDGNNMAISSNKPPSTKRYYEIITVGCQMNMADSHHMESLLQTHLQLSPLPEMDDKADVVILNTCSIRDNAEQKLYHALHPYAARKRDDASLSLIVTGCVAQQEGRALLQRFPQIDLVMGPQYIPRLPSLIKDIERGYQIVATDPTLLEGEDWGRTPSSDIKAFVNAIQGCNEHCTYCVVPSTRGVEQSRPMEHILKQISSLEMQGIKEVTLLGQNIDAYGRDMTPKRNFASLLHAVNRHVDSIERIRFVTSHPRYFSNRVIDAVINCEKVCECFHIPFQSGDDGILKGMRRGYTSSSYMKIIDKIKARAPHASISTDIIVGFPGETDEAFQRTLDIMEQVKFDNINPYTYSPRPNTEASFFRNQIPPHIQSERLQILQRLATKHALEISKRRYSSQIVQVLVEDVNPKFPTGSVMGRTRQNRKVFFDGDLEVLRGRLVDVKVGEVKPWCLMGEMV